MIDIVILSWAKSDKHKQLTIDCLDSLRKCEHYSLFNIMVVESASNIDYKGVKTIYIDKPFNYNMFANEAIRQGKNELIGVFNNDVIFDPNWYKDIMIHCNYDLYSCSPISLTSQTQSEFKRQNKPIAGYKIAKHISGWAIVFTRKLWLKIGGLSEAYSFWCSDDVYAKQLKDNGISHYLIPTSIVNHLDNGSNTLKTLDSKLKDSLTMQQARAWNKDNNDNKFGLK